jgi:hypothetical protein
MKNVPLILSIMLIFASCKQREPNNNIDAFFESYDSTHTKKLVADFRKGKILFADNCAACHISPEGTKTGINMFEHLFEKLPSPAEEYFAKYIRDGKALRESGDKYSSDLYEKFNQTFDHVFTKLSQDDVDQLIVYIKIADKAGERGRRLRTDQ